MHQFGALALTASVVSPRPPVIHSPLNKSTPGSLRGYLLWSALSVWSLCQYAAAQSVYKVTDENGNVTFTDTPPLDPEATVEEHSLHAPNSAQPVLSSPEILEPAESDSPLQFETKIVSPGDNATIPMGPGNFSVQVALSPRLKAGEKLLLLLDGEPVGAPQRIPNWQLNNVYRGEHRLQVLRIDDGGAQLDESDISTVFVMRPIVSK